MNRTIKEATVNSFTYATHEQLKLHLHSFLMAYNFAKRLKGLKGKTHWQFIQNQWTIFPASFIIDPKQSVMGLNTYGWANISIIVFQIEFKYQNLSPSIFSKKLLISPSKLSLYGLGPIFCIISAAFNEANFPHSSILLSFI